MTEIDFNNAPTLTLVSQFLELQDFWADLNPRGKENHRRGIGTLVTKLNNTAKGRKGGIHDDIWRPHLERITQEWLITELGPIDKTGEIE